MLSQTSESDEAMTDSEVSLTPDQTRATAITHALMDTPFAKYLVEAHGEDAQTIMEDPDMLLPFHQMWKVGVAHGRELERQCATKPNGK